MRQPGAGPFASLSQAAQSSCHMTCAFNPHSIPQSSASPDDSPFGLLLINANQPSTPQNCVVEISDDPAHRWAFCIVEAGGTQLLRLSTDNQSSADAWVEALRRAGLRVQMPWDKPTGRGSSTGEQGMPSRAQQDRWVGFMICDNGAQEGAAAACLNLVQVSTAACIT